MVRSIPMILMYTVLLSGCAAKPLVSGGQRVVLSKEPAPAGCVLVGEVHGSQGNFWTAELTSDANLILGARNAVRNAAYTLRANYVKIETESLSHNTGADSLGGTYSVVIVGNAFRCGQTSLVGLQPAR